LARRTFLLRPIPTPPKRFWPVARVHVGKVLHLDQIVEAHRLMEENKAGGKIVVLTS
jgi:hypothetical protein